MALSSLKVFFEDGVKKILPRWEKQISPDCPSPVLPEAARKRRRITLADGSEHYTDTHDEVTWKVLKREKWPLWRKVEAEDSKLGVQELKNIVEIFQEKTAQYKAAMKDRISGRTGALMVTSES